MESSKTIINHPFPPFYTKTSKVLLLGSFPSVKSREEGFYYGHPQNRFWKVIATILEEEVPITIPQKKEMLQKHHIALFDVLASCSIQGSSDQSIKNPVPNNIQKIIEESKIRQIFTTGKKATTLYQKYIYPNTKIEAIELPSTSPANCQTNLDELQKKYQIIKEFL